MAQLVHQIRFLFSPGKSVFFRNSAQNIKYVNLIFITQKYSISYVHKSLDSIFPHFSPSHSVNLYFCVSVVSLISMQEETLQICSIQSMNISTRIVVRKYPSCRTHVIQLNAFMWIFRLRSKVQLIMLCLFYLLNCVSPELSCVHGACYSIDSLFRKRIYMQAEWQTFLFRNRIVG